MVYEEVVGMSYWGNESRHLNIPTQFPRSHNIPTTGVKRHVFTHPGMPEIRVCNLIAPTFGAPYEEPCQCFKTASVIKFHHLSIILFIYIVCPRRLHGGRHQTSNAIDGKGFVLLRGAL